ncbi:hypothetical protein ACJJTC_007301 [Scirpophaga incertulas]
MPAARPAGRKCGLLRHLDGDLVPLYTSMPRPDQLDVSVGCCGTWTGDLVPLYTSMPAARPAGRKCGLLRHLDGDLVPLYTSMPRPDQLDVSVGCCGTWTGTWCRCTPPCRDCEENRYQSEEIMSESIRDRPA